MNDILLAGKIPAPCHPHKELYSKGLCKTCHKKAWDSKNPVARKRHHHATYLRRKTNGKVSDYEYRIKYGISLDQYNEMLEKGFGLCWICLDEPTKQRKLSVDHDHHTGKVRGLLCSRCNFLVGLYERKPDIAENLERYLDATLY